MQRFLISSLAILVLLSRASFRKQAGGVWQRQQDKTFKTFSLVKLKNRIDGFFYEFLFSIAGLQIVREEKSNPVVIPL